MASTEKVNPSRQQVWKANFDKVKKFYDEHGHLTLPKDDPDSARLSYQRHQSTTLKSEQVDLLESINYMTISTHRASDEEKWNAKYERLKQIYQETGNVQIPSNEHALATWLSRQRNLMNKALINPIHQEKLLKLGIEPAKSRKRKASNKSRIYDEKWESKYEKLKEYQRVHGHCRVPRHWEQDKSLAVWVLNQRKKYKEMQTGEFTMDPNRIRKLEEIGFEWTLRKRSYSLVGTR